MPTLEKTCLLSADQIEEKIRRIAFQILEAHFTRKSLTVLGVDARGFALAEQISAQVKDLGNFSCELAQIRVIKNKAQQPIRAECLSKIRSLGTLLLVDDVLNTGLTLSLCLKELLQFRPKQIDTVIFIERSHKLFPIEAKFVGHRLSTILDNYVEVSFEQPAGVYLH